MTRKSCALSPRPRATSGSPSRRCPGSDGSQLAGTRPRFIHSAGKLPRPPTECYRSVRQHRCGPARASRGAAARGDVMDIVARAKAIMLTPKTEWLVIEREPGEPAYLFSNYVAILAAIPAVCGFIGASIIGISLPIVGTVRVGIVSGIVSALVQYVLAFVMVYVMGLIIDALAPTFKGQKNQANALKLAVYSMTPVWLAGVFSLIP